METEDVHAHVPAEGEPAQNRRAGLWGIVCRAGTKVYRGEVFYSKAITAFVNSGLRGLLEFSRRGGKDQPLLFVSGRLNCHEQRSRNSKTLIQMTGRLRRIQMKRPKVKIFGLK